MRILFVEEALQRDAGHWPVYLGDLVDGFRLDGDRVDLLAHRDADPNLLNRLKAVPWLSRSCWTDPSAQGQIGGFRHAFRFASELRGWLCQQAEPYQWICSLTMRLPHLLAYTLLIRTGVLPPSTRCLLLFVQGFGVYSGPGRPAYFPDTSSTRLARWCFRRLRHAVHGGSVMLAAETSAMRDELALFSGLPVQLFPHPVAISSPGASPSISLPITITCPGFARYEKGVDLLQAACYKLWSNPTFADVRIVCQWPEPFALPDGTLLSSDANLEADPRFELINHTLDAKAYDALLQRTDLIILPYRRESYFNRVSRVAIEAAIRGIPLVVTRHTWAEELSSLTSGSLLIEDETPESVLAALFQALSQLTQLRRLAFASTEVVRAFHSVTHFRSLLL